ILERDDGTVLVGGVHNWWFGWLTLVSAPPRTELWTKLHPAYDVQLSAASAGRFYLSSSSGQGAQLKLLEADGETEVWNRTLAPRTLASRYNQDAAWKLLADSSGGVWVAGATSENNLATTPDAWQPQHSGSPLYRYDFGYWFGHLAGLDVTGVRAIVPHPDDSRVVYFAAASDGVYRTGNNGWTWTRRSTGLPPGGVSALVMTTDGLRAVSGSAVYRSTDQGLSWSLVNASLPLSYVFEICADGARLYAAGDQLLRSDDLGATWQKVFDGQVTSVSAAGGRVLAVHAIIGSPPVNSFTVSEASADGGATWIETRLPLASVKQVRFDPARDGVAWVAANNGVLRSLDAGRTWSRIDLRLDFASLAFLPEDPRYLFAAEVGGSSVWRIDKDSGAFTRYAPGIQSVYPDSLVMGDTGVPLLGVGVAPDALIRHYSASGDILYSTWFGGEGGEQVGGIAADPAGGVAVTGSTAISGWAGYDSRPTYLSRPFVFWLPPQGPMAVFFDQDPFNLGAGIQWMTPFGWWLNTWFSVVPVWIMP
ncbi:MAG: hypothetical protein NT090_00260, partial [Acidobacteria bacterium]|nr:hypothetical protein [Acidobacteriota bacterium]